jgi:dimethylaniline monooxygenase (N-oxide forming)
MKTTTIGIIGAGVSGIAAAKECLKKGYHIAIFEKEDDIGGVWYTKSYPGCLLQTPKEAYKFSDVEYPAKTPQYPTHLQVRDYLNIVCDHFNLREYIKFNCNVIQTQFISKKSVWNITYTIKNNASPNTESFDYMIVAGGFYTTPKSSIDIVPKEYIGKTVFSSSEFSSTGTLDYSIFKDKRVVIIGNGATGCDLSTQAHDNKAKSVCVLYRSNKWIYKRYIWGFISIHHIMHRYMLLILKLLPIKLFIIITSIYYNIIVIWSHANFMKFPTPNAPLTRKNFVLSDNFVRKVYKKLIRYQQTTSLKVNKHTIITDTDPIPFDICILAIGYKSHIPFLNMETVPHLYKHILHPDTQQCGFIGYIDALNVAYISELQSKWFIRYIEGNNHPDRTQMIEYINNVYKNKKNTAYDYPDVTFKYAKDYMDLLTTEADLVNKYSCINPMYWFALHDLKSWKERDS